jgi:outer membrane protein TolC
LCGIAAGALLLAACAAGPDYRRPAVDMAVAWKIEPPWREATPNDAAAKGPWWQRFGDPQLDALEQQALAANPTLAAANARLAQARAVVASASSAQFPQVGFGSRLGRQNVSANRPQTNYSSPNFSTVQNDFIGGSP